MRIGDYHYLALAQVSFSINGASLHDGHAECFQQLLHLHISFIISGGVFCISLSTDLAAQRGQTLAQMALSWILRDGTVTSVLIGTSKSSQILDCIGAVSNTAFTDNELKLIDKISL